VNEQNRFQAMQTELMFLRAEMDVNRKYIFERPLAIVAGAFTAAATLKNLVGFDALPMFFTALLSFNIWFTYNRLQSNARIISYLQVFHTPSGMPHWIGWEAALNEYRKREIVPRASTPSGKSRRENRFYGPILFFHVGASLAATGLLLAQIYPTGIAFERLGFLQEIVVILDIGAIAGLVMLTWRFRPGMVRHTIDETRQIWTQLLPPANDEG
jgi:hypothetical protein